MVRLMSLPLIVVHGGATVFKAEFHNDILKAIERAARAGMCAFEKGGSSLDAVESAIYVLEETSLFTAGRGACRNKEGEIELDALIMDGNRLESGAVMAVRDIIHPISLARYVLERTSCYQIAGNGANRLYKKMIADGYRTEVEPTRTLHLPISEGCDTVGAVAVDTWGRIASGASTSGWPGKLAGRIGDTPIIGAGVYANDIAASSCTGKGEQILRITMARMAVNYVEEGYSVGDASDKIMAELRQKTTGEAGLILADAQGNVAVRFDTPHMPTAILRKGEAVEASMIPGVL
jgi:beta-aspartyl-peptidase (threonine type)